MGILRMIFGGGARAMADATIGVTEIFRPNSEAEAHRTHTRFEEVLDQYGQEYLLPREGWFDQFANGLNRLPRPILAFSVIGLFGYAMVDPLAFAERMTGLQLVPDQLWWLMGGIVSFYFGARELHKFRASKTPITEQSVQNAMDKIETIRAIEREPLTSKLKGGYALSNPALVAWLNKNS